MGNRFGYSIELNDEIDSSIEDKLKGIADNATRAAGANDNLQKSLNFRGVSNSLAQSLKTQTDFAKATGTFAARTTGDLRKVQRAWSAAGRTIDTTNKTINKLGGNRISNFLFEFANTAQDAQFGFRGVANNIPVLFRNFQLMAKEAGSAESAVQQLVLAGLRPLAKFAAPVAVVGTIAAIGAEIASVRDEVELFEGSGITFGDSLRSSGESIREMFRQIGVEVDNTKGIIDGLTKAGIKGFSELQNRATQLARLTSDGLIPIEDIRQERQNILERDKATLASRANRAAQEPINDSLAAQVSQARELRALLEDENRSRQSATAIMTAQLAARKATGDQALRLTDAQKTSVERLITERQLISEINKGTTRLVGARENFNKQMEQAVALNNQLRGGATPEDARQAVADDRLVEDGRIDPASLKRLQDIRDENEALTQQSGIVKEIRELETRNAGLRAKLPQEQIDNLVEDQRLFDNGADEDAIAARRAAINEFNSLTRQSQQPLAQYRQQIQELDERLRIGELSQRQYNAAVRDAALAFGEAGDSPLAREIQLLNQIREPQRQYAEALRTLIALREKNKISNREFVEGLSDETSQFRNATGRNDPDRTRQDALLDRINQPETERRQTLVDLQALHDRGSLSAQRHAIEVEKVNDAYDKLKGNASAGSDAAQAAQQAFAAGGSFDFRGGGAAGGRFQSSQFDSASSSANSFFSTVAQGYSQASQAQQQFTQGLGIQQQQYAQSLSQASQQSQQFAQQAFQGIGQQFSSVLQGGKFSFRKLLGGFIGGLFQGGSQSPLGQLFRRGIPHAGNGFGAQGIQGRPFGFMSGGYTGNVGRRQVAGVVHGREFVAHADATRRNRAALEQMNRTGKLPNQGGNMNVVVNNNAGVQVVANQLDAQTVEVMIERQMSRNADRTAATALRNPNSRLSKGLSRHTSTRRRRR